VWAITEIINNIAKIIANHFAIVNEIPERIPKPNIPATIATTKNTIAHINQSPYSSKGMDFRCYIALED
jgi:hypothetical protein